MTPERDAAERLRLSTILGAPARAEMRRALDEREGAGGPVTWSTTGAPAVTRPAAAPPSTPSAIRHAAGCVSPSDSDGPRLESYPAPEHGDGWSPWPTRVHTVDRCLDCGAQAVDGVTVTPEPTA